MIELNNFKNYNTHLPIWNYYVISEKCSHIDLGEYCTYGLEVNYLNYTAILHDISTYIETVSRIAELFNNYQLSPIHLKEVTEDMIP